MRVRTKRLSFVLVLACVLSMCSGVLALGQNAGKSDSQLQADVQTALRGKDYRDVRSSVQNGVVTLTGSVDRFSAKASLQKKVEKMQAASIDNQINVNVPPGVTDQDLYNKLAKSLTYDRNGYGTTPFNNITLQISHGMVAIGGIVVEPADKESALGLIANTPGVRGVEDHLQVAPVSPNDWQIRRAVYRAVYGAPQLNRYSIDPAKPIRIIVVGGNVTLVGVVSNTGDRDVAGIRANGVPGVFSVKNNLQVQGQAPER